MRARSSSKLIDVVMPPVRQAILSATLLHPERSWYSADLARHVGSPRSSLQRELSALTEAGILKSFRKGRMVFYQADTQCPVFPELQGLLSKTAGLVDVLRDSLSRFEDRIKCSFIYGSVARGQEVTTSDIDLMVIGRIGLVDIASSIRDSQEKLGRDVNPKLYSEVEFSKRLADKNHFLLNVIQKPKLFVLGSERELAQLAKRKPGGRRTT